MTSLEMDNFTVGSVFDVRAAGEVLPFRLDKALALSGSGREGGSFRLEFLGPAAPVLPQAIYAFATQDAAHEIFIVPIARDAAGVRYEAIFY